MYKIHEVILKRIHKNTTQRTSLELAYEGQALYQAKGEAEVPIPAQRTAKVRD